MRQQLKTPGCKAKAKVGAPNFSDIRILVSELAAERDCATSLQ